MVAAVRLPVIGNGDVRSVEDARAMVAATGCAAVMIGRGSLGAPWIFRGAPLDRDGRAAIIRRHAALIEAHLPERLALVQLKKHLAWYSAGLPGSAALRPRLFAATAPAEVQALFWDIVDGVVQRWFEDFQVGDRFGSPAKTLTDAHFMFFAGMTGDAHPIHYDDEYARKTRFGRRLAHGLLLDVAHRRRAPRRWRRSSSTRSSRSSSRPRTSARPSSSATRSSRTTRWSRSSASARPGCSPCA